MIGQQLIQALVGPGASSGLTYKSFKLSLIPVLGGYPVCGPFWLVKIKPEPGSKSGWMMGPHLIHQFGGTWGIIIRVDSQIFYMKLNTN
jgi:hypothetical protein